MKKLKNLTILFVLTTLFIVVGGPLPEVQASPAAAVAPDLGIRSDFCGPGQLDVDQYRFRRFRWERGYQSRHFGHRIPARYRF